MQRFFTIIGLLTTVALMILGINSILPQGGFIVVDGERIGTWVPNEPAITLPVIEDHSPHDIELTLPDPVGPATSLYYTAIDYIEAKDGLEGAQEFHEAVEDNIRQGAYKHELAAIVAAIRYAENGTTYQYGIIHKRCPKTYRGQAGWCAATVQKNWDRYLTAGGDSRDIVSYITYLGGKYCPIGADNDPNGLNKHWIENVTHHYNRNHFLSLCK